MLRGKRGPLEAPLASRSVSTNDSLSLYVIGYNNKMPKEEKRPKNRKVKHNRDKQFTPLSKEQI